MNKCLEMAQKVKKYPTQKNIEDFFIICYELEEECKKRLKKGVPQPSLTKLKCEILEKRASEALELIGKLKFNFKSPPKNLKGSCAWGRTKIQLKEKWDRAHTQKKLIKSMKNVNTFSEWVKILKKDEKEGKRKPRWASY